MKRIEFVLVAVIVLLTILWLAADPILRMDSEFFALRTSLINYTGILGIGAMSVAMVLVLRLGWIESFLGGLDKAYRLHKWLGITGLVFSVLHFLLANVPKVMVDAGWLEAPAQRPVPQLVSAILQFFQSQQALAEEFGDWGFKVAVVLIAIALIKWFPYRIFFWSHRPLALVYLFLAFHSLALMNFDYWHHAVAPVIAVLLAGGTVAAIISLIGKVGSHRRAVGEIENVQYLENNRVIKVAIRLKSRWDGHEEGQFAFVTFDKREGAHPFTITTPWKGDGKVGFFIKELGDYTSALPAKLKQGGLVTVEGPYGRFGFDTPRQRQVWIAGGIGIAPFATRIKALVDKPDGRVVDFFYSASERDDDRFIDRITTASKQACPSSKISGQLML